MSGVAGWDALGGQMIYLGPSPDVPLEQRGPMPRLRQDKDRFLPGELPGSSEQHIDIPCDALSGLLRGVHQDLAGFLAALRQWVQGIVPDLADQLALAVDRRSRISAPPDV